MYEARDTDTLSKKRVEALDRIDKMPPELRKCVHEYGLPIVSVCLKHGVKEPNKIRELVREIWSGARETAQRNQALGLVDWILLNSGSSLTVKGLNRLLADSTHVISPIEPTRTMLNASMAEVANFNERVTKEEKHRRRLRAALRAHSLEILK